MPRLHVAVLDEELPFPLNSGKRIRTFNLLTRLAKTHRITYIAHRNADADELRAAARALREFDIFPMVVDHAVPAKAGSGFYGRLFANLFSPLPYSVATHASAAMRGAIDRLTRDDQPDLWHCEWTPYAHAMFRRPGPWVVMAHNVESLIWQRYAENEANPLKHWFLQKQWRRFRRFEGWAYSAATRTIAVTREDAARIERDFFARDVAVVDNGVDTSFFKPDDSVTPDPHRLLFLGSLDWRPNLDAVRLLLDEIMPKVQAAVPRATLAIVGRKPPESLRAAIAKRSGIELHADVPDVRPFLHAAGMLVVPLRIGGGSRLKILEALACGTPVVTTTIGVEGLRLRSGEHVTVADGGEAFATAVIDSINRPTAMQLQAALGRSRVLAEYDWSELANKLHDVWLTANESGQRMSGHLCNERARQVRPGCRLH
jgi:glycosyltransferase involved in cell wall biosynthesis